MLDPNIECKEVVEMFIFSFFFSFPAEVEDHSHLKFFH